MRKTTLVLAMMFTVTSFAAESPYATGGEVTTFLSANGQYQVYVHTFTNTANAAVFRNIGKQDLSLRYLVVGAGGSGGYGGSGTGGKNIPTGGGGGGGGVFETNDVPFAVGSRWSVLVGKGAAPVVSNTNPGTMAGASSISNSTDEVVLVPGGGNGAKSSTNKSKVVNPTEGAAGGGASTYTDGPGRGTYRSSVFGVVPEGAPFAGGAINSYSYIGCGGGGAGAAGTGETTLRAGNGGVGLSSDITGGALVYGSGGGGGANVYSNRKGGSGGARAGNGATYEIVGTVTNFFAATTPAANSGCGGAGGMQDGNNDASSSGADGIVVIRYQVSVAPCIGGDIVTKTLVSGTRYAFVHQFTNSAVAAQLVNASDRELTLRYLVVGAGGAGAIGRGTYGGGGAGGGGGVYENEGYKLLAGSQLSVTVGQGAAAVTSVNGSDAAGASILSDNDSFLISVPGGGNGAYAGTSSTVLGSGATCGAGGGGGSQFAVPQGGETSGDGAAGTYQSSQFGVSPKGTSPGVGFAGGDYRSRVGGGGGGAAAGVSGFSHQHGGDGLASDITGESLVYGSGGGGGGMCPAFATPGGTGGARAGNGGTYEVVDLEGGLIQTNFLAATTPAANSGCGGGGGLASSSAPAADKIATAGANGVVIIRYEYDPVKKGLILIFR